MIATTLIIVALLFFVVIVGGARFVYSLISTINHNHNMQSDMKTKALDVFVYLGIAISLVVSVTNLLQIVFAAVDRKFPDIVSSSYVDMTQSDVRFAIASLVVMFPVYLILSWYTSRDIKKFLYKQDIFIRKAMIYCTLFITILTLIGTLVYAIYTYLGGELSVRFGYKSLAVFLLSLGLLSYYYYSLKRDFSKKTFIPTILSLVVSLIVLASVVWSISIIGSPSVMRAKKIDSTRLSDISRIQQEVFNRFQSTDKLPLTLVELDNAFQGYQVPTDPITKETYGYKVIQQPLFKTNYTTNKKELVSPAIFELCATFSTVRKFDSRGPVISSPSEGGMLTDSSLSVANYYSDGDQSPFWNHDATETCFKRVISSDMYYGK